MIKDRYLQKELQANAGKILAILKGNGFNVEKYEKLLPEVSATVERRKEWREKYFARPDIKAKKSEYQREYRNRPEIRAYYRAYQKEYLREYVKRDYVRARIKAYSERPDVKARKRERNELCREEINAKGREYYAKNKEHIKERRRAYQKEYCHRPEVLARRREYQKQQRLLHPERYKAYDRKKYEKRREQDRLKKEQSLNASNNTEIL